MAALHVINWAGERRPLLLQRMRIAVFQNKVAVSSDAGRLGGCNDMLGTD